MRKVKENNIQYSTNNTQYSVDKRKFDLEDRFVDFTSVATAKANKDINKIDN